MSRSNRILEYNLLGEETEITPELVAYYKENPGDLDLIIDKEFFYGRFIRFFFILGIVLTVASRIIMLLLKDTRASFVNDVVLDIISELGIAVFGGAITAYFLEKMKQKQYEDNVRFRNEILKKIHESEA
ncbi:MAG: hypothetical protein F6K11_01060 [Leptolyngbya sp. SIO3F4]|nr:hypothetical protein [Leptolyngbya sp. SIO3F4]